VQAHSACSVLEIDQADFMSIARANPNLLRTLLRQIIGHLRKNDQAVIRELNIKNAALQRTYADLAEQEALRTQFIATLAHELRTPLTSAKGFLGLIQQGAIQGDSLPAAVESVARNVDKVVGLTNDLLILYEMHPTETEYAYVNVADVLIEALHGAKEAAQGQLPVVQMDIAPDLPEIVADKRALTLALRALIENAFKYDPAGNPVSIRARSGEGSEIVLAIEDQGIGIPVEAQRRIFEPFFRIETEGGTHLFPGLGIGLTIAKFIVGRHNGRIQVDSQIGKGSTFTVRLPQAGPADGS
jgi:signal transduction histidine kinase